MANIQELLKNRAAAVQAAKLDGAIPGTSSPDKVAALAASAPPLSNIATGLQGSQESAGFITAQASSVMEAEFNPELAETALAVYQSISLRKFHKPKGREVRPVNGFYYAQDEIEVKMLEDYAASGKVILYTPSEEE